MSGDDDTRKPKASSRRRPEEFPVPKLDDVSGPIAGVVASSETASTASGSIERSTKPTIEAPFAATASTSSIPSTSSTPSTPSTSSASPSSALSTSRSEPDDPSQDTLEPLAIEAIAPTPTAALRSPLRYAPPDDDEDHDDRDDHDDHDNGRAKPGGRKLAVFGALGIVAAVGIAATILVGRVNSGHYQFVCTSDKIVAEQGRAFPPWGSRALTGAEWKPVEIPPEAECQTQATDSDYELQGWFLAALEARATVLLSEREVSIAKVDLAEQHLQQALLLARTPDRKPRREAINQLLGDVGYYRASAKLRESAAALLGVAKEFETAGATGAKTATDAKAWALYVRTLADELAAKQAGTVVVPPIPAPIGVGSDRVPAPPGVALPVEQGSDSSPSGSGSGAPPDAGVSSGGVLL